MNKPDKKERKRRIKDQNAEKKAARPLRILDEPKTPEEFERQMFAVGMILFGVMELFTPDAMRELLMPQGVEHGKDQFPSELDT